MTLENIIDIYSSSRSKHFVIKRNNTIPNKTFPMIKNYSIEVWDVKEHKVIEAVDKNFNTSIYNPEEVINELERIILEKVFYGVK